MKRLISLCFAALLAFSLAVPTFADVIWEPEDAFYQKHADDCALLQRSFYANGADGYINLHESPESAFVTGQLENGAQLYIYWQYEDWGYLEGDVTGWVALEDLQLIYDYISFEEEYGDEFLPYDAEQYRPLMENWTGDTLALWPYPGAEKAEYVWQDAADGMADLKEYGFDSIFVDEEGYTWGYRGYLYGNRNFWVCLDDPGDRTFTVRQVDQPELIPAATPKTPLFNYVPMTLGIVIAAVATLILGKRYGPKRKQLK